MNNSDKKRITDVFYQSAGDGIPAYYAVQYRTDSSAFVDYEYFETKAEADKFAEDNGWDQ